MMSVLDGKSFPVGNKKNTYTPDERLNYIPTAVE